MDQKIIIETASAAETEQFGEDIGRRLKGGEIIELISDLGGGKTTLVRGLARGAGSGDHVSSPTFTVSKEYNAGDLVIHHFDFYRLDDAGLLTHEIADLFDDIKAVVVVEWGNVVQHILPDVRLRIEILQKDDTNRDIHLSRPDELAYLTDENHADIDD